MKVLLATLAFSFMTVAMAGNDFKKFPPHGKKLQKMLRSLDLSQEQEEKLQSLHQEHKSHFKELKSKMKEGHARLNTAISENASDEQLKAIFTEISRTRSEMMGSRFEKLLAIRGTLNPDQRQEFGRIFQETIGRKRR